MYESFFEMEQTPFTRDIPIDRLYTSPRIEDALGRLVYVVDHQMFAVVTANPGCGKSTMVRMLNGRLGKEKYLLLYLSDSKLTPRWLYAGLLGQLEQKLKLQAYEAIRQRIDMNIVLGRLDRAETGKYIAAHMAYAGAGKEIFTSGAEDEVYKISAGIPRMINRVCEKALMYACQQQKRLLDEHMVRFVADHEMLGGAGGIGHQKGQSGKTALRKGERKWK